MRTYTIQYQQGENTFEGFVAYEEGKAAKLPAVIICHDWSGRNEFACQKAEALAKLGYLGFALDLYGKGKLGTTNDEKSKLMQPLIQNRKELLSRLVLALNKVKSLESVDASRIAAIGFCFGGLCALDLARGSNDLKGVVSFHGLLNAPDKAPNDANINAKILVLHGYDDPMVKPELVDSFAQEMTSRNADWQIHMYGHTVHAFTNPHANDKDFGTVYEAKAAKRSWVAMQNFLAEIFS